MISKNFTPRPYQNLILSHEIDIKRSNVWAGMGMGKTVATLTALEDLFMAGSETQPALVLAPLRVASSTWPDEAVKWNHLRNIDVQPIIGTAKERMTAIKNTNASVFTINYDNLVWLVEIFGEHWPFGTIIADESTRLKSFRLRKGGKRAAALAKVAHKHVHRWVNLTGTPSPNGLIDLWGQAWFVDQGQRLGRTYSAFTSRWFNNIQFPGQQWSKLEPWPFAQEQMQDALRDVTISLDAADWFDIEEPIHNIIKLELPAKARKQYQEMEKEMFLELEHEGLEALNAAAKTVKCLQIASGAIYTDNSKNWVELHDAKIQALESIISESGGMPILVAYHWKHDLERLLKAFPKGKKLDADPQTLRDWNAGKIPILFAHPASAGHGLNLQDGGNILVFFSHWWDLEQYQQIIERIGPTRQIQAGYNRPVFIHHLIAAGTMDEVVMERRNSKREIQDLLLEAMKKK
ncbi:DEAD/DEAH box helicase [Providencia rettgeri]|uniref:DEAD/DEAH box helicase n=1 Tax=Providencia rettgeri TaxID=587 RepID=UPI001BAA3277|nr:DEAD/DEAH box helicase [Providencia rettgeri]MBS0859600.1 DEAD/DEAH box helicase [Providencia rettgeri]MBS0873057.1 DEAD/DEAH box helicase [Providencia rettgeri]MBS0920649.1 DEAD/DEAH box helicase [Providencia rettgeri]